MENIIEPNELFDFSKLSLTLPTNIQGGAYFTKIQYHDKPLYIQTTKSLTRQGIVKSGKKYYCDLMFDHHSETLIHWFESLEEKCHQLIYEKSDTWFQNALEMNDVESAFNSIIRIYKSGKFYLVRSNIKTSSLTNEPVIKIYNENEVPVSFSDITNETNIISILEIQGIKFTTRNFQIEIDLKQIMVLDNDPIFESCLIKTSKKNINVNNSIMDHRTLEIKEDEESLENKKDSLEEKIDDNTNESTTNDESIDDLLTRDDNKMDVDISTSLINEKDDETISTSLMNEKYDETISTSLMNNDTKKPNEAFGLVIEDLEVEEEPKELSEVDVSLENDLETMVLKKPNQVYFDLYKEARNKAKEAKKSLILAYLEAKNIKKTYMLDNFDDNSDSDLDAEIDEISESELEGL